MQLLKLLLILHEQLGLRLSLHYGSRTQARTGHGVRSLYWRASLQIEHHCSDSVLRNPAQRRSAACNCVDALSSIQSKYQLEHNSSVTLHWMYVCGLIWDRGLSENLSQLTAVQKPPFIYPVRKLLWGTLVSMRQLTAAF